MNLTTICRLCFNSPESLSEMSSIAMEMSLTCLGMQLKSISGSKICSKCLDFLERICNFKLMCLESEKQLLELINLKKEVLSIASLKVEDEEEFVEEEPALEIEDGEGFADMEIDVFDPSSTVEPKVRKKRSKEVAKQNRKKYNVGMKDTIVQCEECGDQMKYNRLRAHRFRKHKPLFECDICGKKITEKSALKRHILNIHLKVRTVFCPLCPNHEGFVDKSALKVHTHIHHNTKFVCTYCGVERKTKYALRCHIATTHEKVNRFPCPHCNAPNVSEVGLNYHIQSSHKNSEKFSNFGELNVTCVCGIAFYSRKIFRNHLNEDHRDAEGKMFQCPQPCGRIYCDRGKLVFHFRKYHKMGYKVCKRYKALKTETGEYFCDVCGEEFDKLVSLSIHRSKKHREIYRNGETYDQNNENFMLKTIEKSIQMVQ